MANTTILPALGASSLRVGRALAARSRLLAALLGTVLALSIVRGVSNASRGSSVEQALGAALRKEGLELDTHQVVWLSDAPSLLGLRPAMFVAHAPQELNDVYYAEVRLSGKAVLETRSLTNVTRTSSADEAQLTAALPFVAYAARVGDVYDALVVLDTRGEPSELTQAWPWYAKLQNSITNFQDTGRLAAFGVRRYNFVDAPSTLSLTAKAPRFELRADEQRLSINPWRDDAEHDAAALEIEPAQKGQPGLITWVVDTVRRVPWIGRGPIEWLEHTVFGITDKANRAYHEVVATDTAAEVKEALSVSEEPVVPAPPRESTDEAIGWPPAALTPVLPDAVQGEGAWLPVANDPFVADNPSGRSLFYQTFIRVDPERAFTRVYVTLWDSRQVQLGIVMGTKEPESATGETGDGSIPRDPFVISHLVAGFNGGFQAMHGEFGMMAERRVYIPPKPFAATVAVFEDGQVGMGSWPGPGRRAWDEELANSQIPSKMIAMRQNLTSVVEDGKYNPWARWWWGAAPEWAEEQTYIPRSGLCLTQEGFLGFFWGESMGPEELGKAMNAARCVRGMHLDMNGKHTGFELYRPFMRGEEMPPLGRALRATEAEGEISEMRGHHFRTRLAVTTMTPVRFPRYIARDPRDYFYLTRKPLLPGSDVTLGNAKLKFSSQGLPDAGFPQAFARASHEHDDTSITRIDVTRAVPAPFADTSLSRRLATLANVSTIAQADASSQIALVARHRHGRLRLEIGPPARGSATLIVGTELVEGSSARSALGVDAEGFLVFVQARTPAGVRAALTAAGVGRALAVEGARLEFSSAQMPDAGVDGDLPASAGLAFMAESRPAASVLFGDVEPMPYRKWGYLQDQRVRYFPTAHPARFPTPEAVR